LPLSKPITEERKAQIREYMRAKRAAAHERGEVIPEDIWWRNNPEANREKGRRWRSKNQERAREVTRQSQKTRRSTPWGQINNRLWPIMHWAVIASRRNPYIGSRSKYTRALGYTWATLRAHLEAQFLPGMEWDNWGSVWELDHIRPVSGFRYISLDDPLFREAWHLDNLRPLWRADNQAKGRRLA
jgi:hypothetical protein